MYARPSAPLGFGDLLVAGWFYSAYLRRDAESLEVASIARGGRRNWTEANPSPDRDLVLAHGQPLPVVLLNDPCEIESVLDRRGGSRLLVAGVTPWNDNAVQWHREGRQRDFRRHLLPPADGYPGGVVQFSALFLVVDRCVREARRDWALDRAAQVNLEVAWEAYAVRRGPRAIADNTRKLAALLTAPRDDGIVADVLSGTAFEDPAATRIRLAIDDVLGVAWDLEGAALNDVADTAELTLRGSLSEDEQEREVGRRHAELRDGFTRLRHAADLAVQALESGTPGAAAQTVEA